MPPSGVVAIALGLLIVATSVVFPVVVARYRHLHTATNLSLCAMSVTDCALGASMVLHTLLQTWWPEVGFSSASCVVFVGVTCCCPTITNGVMFWMALDRRLSVRHPLLYPLLVTAGSVRWQLLLTVATVLLLMGYVIGVRLLTGPPLPDTMPRCFVHLRLVLGDVGSLLLNGVNLLTTAATVWVCVEVLVVARRALRPNVAVLPHQLAERARLRQHVRTFFYLLRIVLVYGVCLVPFCTVSLLRAVADIRASLDAPEEGGASSSTSAATPEEVDGDQSIWLALILLRTAFNLIDSWLYCSSPELQQAILHFIDGTRFNLYP